MPPSAKRSQRPRRELVNKVDVPDSSPSRPAKRRRKAEEPVEKVAETVATLPTDRSGLDLTDEELVEKIVPFLTVPPYDVQAREDLANTLHEEQSKEGIQAYAKIAGRDWTFYVKRLKNNIGRPPEGAPRSKSPQVVTAEALSHSAPSEDDNKVHIDLGPSKTVSRHHAEIYFDDGRWFIVVNGRNGIKIDNIMLKRGDRLALISGQVIEISGVEMMFVLPDDKVQVQDEYLQRAGLIQADKNDDRNSVTTTLASPHLHTSKLPGQVPIAPAPSDYRRPGTPVSAHAKSAPGSSGKSPAYGNGVSMLINGENIDMSAEESSSVKPSFSYSQLISQAILAKPEQKVNLAGIYQYIVENYAYYRNLEHAGWQNSIRHNLSLNKQFKKMPRGNEEPGKGMKWYIVPEAKEEMAKTAFKGGRGGHRGSSVPQSPNNITYMNSRKELASAQKSNDSPRLGSPPLSSYPPSNAPQFTPDRGGRHVQDRLPGDDGSPLPRNRRTQSNGFGLSDNVLGSPPALSSSYLQEEPGSWQTPAPVRVHPRLAPPSTAQKPSQHMATSSPAPFWKYADVGTPFKGVPLDISPIKGAVTPGIPQSSSPPPPIRRSSVASPTRSGSPTKRPMPDDDLEDEDQGFDLTKGFQNIGSYHMTGAVQRS